MRVGKESLEIEAGLIWVNAIFTKSDGSRWWDRLVLDTATAHTSLSADFAAFLGFDESKQTGTATWDTPFGPVDGYTVRLPGLNVMGRELTNYLIGCQTLSATLHVPGILGLDFFTDTDLRLAFQQRLIYLSW